MVRQYIIGCLLLLGTVACSARPIVYNGDTLPVNKDFVKTQCGTLDIKENIIEVSGIACSRVTPGYIWMQSDETERYIIATDKEGAKRYMTVRFDKRIRWDWEDMSGGVYDGKDYLFIGAFGDNEETDGNYSIVYFEEPPITFDTITITPNCIKYVYPDGKKHNAEALMYDNIEQMIYVITKVYYDVCQVFRIPFRLDYGDEEQTLEYICDLGVKSDLGTGAKPYRGFHLVTAADISPDGKFILIKNHNNIVAAFCWVLMWTRDGEESVAETLKRQPENLACYNMYEWQGEAICWLDSTLFYTTSDADDGNPPIFQYVKTHVGIESVQADDNGKAAKIFLGDMMYIRNKEGLYTIDGRKVQ
jgi:hypothetical protein